MSREKIGSVYSSRQGLDNIWVPTFATLMRQLQRRRGRPGQEEASSVGGVGGALQGSRGDICQLLGTGREAGRRVWGVWGGVTAVKKID